MTSHDPAPQPFGTGDYLPFIIRSLIVLALVAFALLLWRVREAFLLAFAAVLIALLVLAAADPIRKWTNMSRGWSLLAAVSLLALLLVGAGWLVGSTMRDQVSDLISRLPLGIQIAEQRLGISIPGEEMLGRSGPNEDGLQDATKESAGAENSTGFSLLDDLLGQLLSWGRLAVAIATGFILVIAAGIYLASNPEAYSRGLAKLFPKRVHERVIDTLNTCGTALRVWLLTQLLAMTLIGILAGFGTWLIGLPAPLALGLFAGLAEFVPFVGSIAGAIPALLIAMTQSTGAVLWTLALFIGIQQIESNVIAPLLERRMLRIPPAVFLFSVLAFGLLFGLLGILLAAPLTVAAYVLVDKLYVRAVLGEEVKVPGEE
jgi:predicted PurR-regulated permease PerM